MDFLSMGLPPFLYNKKSQDTLTRGFWSFLPKITFDPFVFLYYTPILSGKKEGGGGFAPFSSLFFPSGKDRKTESLTRGAFQSGGRSENRRPEFSFFFLVNPGFLLYNRIDS